MIFSKKTSGSQKQPANKMISDTLHAALKQLPQPLIPFGAGFQPGAAFQYHQVGILSVKVNRNNLADIDDMAAMNPDETVPGQVTFEILHGFFLQVIAQG